jgi:hypothetical protein
MMAGRAQGQSSRPPTAESRASDDERLGYLVLSLNYLSS